MATVTQLVSASILRGDLPPASFDSRAITKMAKNPKCQRMTALLLAGSSPANALKHIFGKDPKESQSPIALNRGRAFERAQTEEGAARLIATLREEAILNPDDESVCDIGRLQKSKKTSKEQMEFAVTLTDRMLRRKARGEANAPVVLLQAALRIQICGREVVLRPDLLVARPEDLMYRAGELKSYPFQHHLTDQGDIAQACAQIGVYGVALQMRLAELGIDTPVLETGVLVMAKPGSFDSVARVQTIARDMAAARRILASRPDMIQEVRAALSRGEKLDSRKNLMKLVPNYCGQCRSYCALHEVCRAEAEINGNPAILGDEAAALLGQAGSIYRVVELLAGADPVNQAEVAVVAALRDAAQFYEAA